MEAEQLNALSNQLQDLAARSAELRRFLQFDEKQERLVEVCALSENPDIWNDAKRAQELGRERKLLEGWCSAWTRSSKT